MRPEISSETNTETFFRPNIFETYIETFLLRTNVFKTDTESFLRPNILQTDAENFF